MATDQSEGEYHFLFDGENGDKTNVDEPTPSSRGEGRQVSMANTSYHSANHAPHFPVGSEYSRGQSFAEVSEYSAMTTQNDEWDDVRDNLEPDELIKLRVFRIIYGPFAPEDVTGRRIHTAIQTAVIAFIVCVILETVKDLYKQNKLFFEIFTFILALVITAEWLLSLWSVTVLARFQHPVYGRLKWQMRFLPFCDLIVVVSFWASEILFLTTDANGASAHSPHKILSAFRVLRLFRLIRVFELFQSRKVKKAFKLLSNVVARKGDDVLAALLIMFVSLIFVATAMYLIEGNHDHGFDSFDSIPVSMYWGVITLTTIGYGDIYPRTTLGMILCCFVGFYAVCIGSIPIGIIGAGYVEELQRCVEVDKALQRSYGRAELVEKVEQLKALIEEVTEVGFLSQLHDDELESIDKALASGNESIHKCIFNGRLEAIRMAVNRSGFKSPKSPNSLSPRSEDGDPVFS